MPNQLADEISLYLLQHAENPVQWHSWNPAALELARDCNKPIFLSIGYSSCHWCHVMAHESFEDNEIARILNENFISIKVDREERPDLDQIYMEAVQLMTGHGGWPLSVFLTPDKEPFFGGTYWPARPQFGMPGFDQILEAVAETWHQRRAEVLDQAAKVTGFLRESDSFDQVGDTIELDEKLLEAAESTLVQSFDAHYGGFGPAPKFPQPLVLQLLLNRWSHAADDELLHIVTTTLDRMAMGGIYDHLGGGFHRYSVDARWLVPHFEKMLYDNALLTIVYLKTWQATGQDIYADVVRETLDYILRDMTGPRGGFYSTEDADSEGEEGKFYLWTLAEVRSVLGPDAAATFGRIYGVTESGNFEGKNILNLNQSIELEAKILGRDPVRLKKELADARKKLFFARETRTRPARDDKILVAWNGLIIDALAQAGAVLGEKRYTDAAVNAAIFLRDSLRDQSGRLMHYARDGHVKYIAYLDDYAALGNAFITLHETGSDGPWLADALEFSDELLQRFADRKQDAFFYTASDQEPLITRKKDFIDSSIPSGNGLAAMLFLRLARLCNRDDYNKTVQAILQYAAPLMQQYPQATCQLLTTLDMQLSTS